jgi:hypothetical protein
MTENTLMQEKRRGCIPGVAYRALFSSTAHGVMWVFLWLYCVMYSMYITYLTQHSPRLTLTTLCWHTMLPLSCVYDNMFRLIVTHSKMISRRMDGHYHLLLCWHTMLPQNCLLIYLLGSFQQISTGYLPCVHTQWNSWVVLKHIVTPKLCTEYFDFGRLIFTTLDWVSTVRNALVAGRFRQ